MQDAGLCRVRLSHLRQKCTYTDIVVEFGGVCRMESLRVMPPVPMTIRQAAKSNWIEGHWVRKGTYFYIPVSLYTPSPHQPSAALIHACYRSHRSASSTPPAPSGAKTQKPSVPPAGSTFLRTTSQIIILCRSFRARTRALGRR